MPVAVTVAAADVNNRRRLMLKSGLAMTPSCKRRAGATAKFADFVGHIPVSGKPPCRLKPVGRERRPRLNAGMYMQQRLKRINKGVARYKTRYPVIDLVVIF